MRAFFMLTYRSTNTKTGRYYIGSAKSYCHYMNRIGNHHVRKGQKEFWVDLQQDPKSFVWEILREDDLDTRDYEYELLQKHVGDPLCYNKSATNGAVRGVAQRGTGWEHSEETKQKMSSSAYKTRDVKSRTLSKVVNSKQPCPHCGKLMNPGNLTQHIRARTCQRK